MSADERAPLLAQGRLGQNDAEAMESAISIALDPSASAFNFPATIPEEEPESAPVASAISIAPELRSDRFLILGALWIGTFLAALDSTIVATVLSQIGSEFHKSNQVTWIGTSYLLTQTAFQPLYGRGSDIFGRKPATLFASIVFLVGSLFCGLSQSLPQLIAARAIAGIGGGGLTTMASIVTSDLIPLKQRGVYQGYGNLVFALGAALGGPLGGLFGDTLGWKWAFLIQVPLCFVHAAAVVFKVDIPAGPGSMMEKIKRIDVFGALTLVGGIAFFILGASFGGNEYPWGHPIVYGSLIASLVLIIAFVVVEKYVARQPIMPLRVLFTRTPGFVSLTNWFISMSQFGILYNVPMYHIAVEQQTSGRAGLYLIPNAVLASTASLLCGFYIARQGKYRSLLIWLAVLAVLGPLAMSFWNRQSTPEIGYWLSMIPGGIGFGGLITVTLVALIAAVQPEDMAAATGISYLFRATGSVLGISLSTSLLQNTLKTQLTKTITGPHAKEIIANIRIDVSYIATLHGKTKEAAIDAYQYSMHRVFILLTVCAILAFISACFIGKHSLSSKK